MAVQEYSTVAPLHSFVFPIMGTFTGSVTGMVRFVMPFKCRIVYADAVARSISGTADATITVQDDGANAVSAITLVAGTNTAGTIAAAAVAKDSVITINFAIGSATNAVDITVQLLVSLE